MMAFIFSLFVRLYFSLHCFIFSFIIKLFNLSLSSLSSFCLVCLNSHFFFSLLLLFVPTLRRVSVSIFPLAIISCLIFYLTLRMMAFLTASYLKTPRLSLPFPCLPSFLSSLPLVLSFPFPSLVPVPTLTCLFFILLFVLLVSSPLTPFILASPRLVRLPSSPFPPDTPLLFLHPLSKPLSRYLIPLPRVSLSLFVPETQYSSSFASCFQLPVFPLHYFWTYFAMS